MKLRHLIMSVINQITIDYFKILCKENFLQCLIILLHFIIPLVFIGITVYLFLQHNIFASSFLCISFYSIICHYIQLLNRIASIKESFYVMHLSILLKYLSPGDMYDKWTICNIKFEKTGSKIIEKQLSGELLNLLSFESFYLKQLSKEQRNSLDKYVIDLKKINEYQWNLEDLVRQHGLENNSQKLKESCYEARLNNEKRIEIKNKINQLFGKPIEYKKYK